MGLMVDETGSGNWINKMRPEQRIIVLCARAQIDPSAKDAIRALICDGLNWHDVVANAMQHRLSPILYECIANTARDLISPVQMDVLRAITAASTANDMALLRELLRLYGLFEDAKIPVIPYKGPVLAWVAFGSYIRREYVDLDFAVQQEYIPAANAVMISAGYRATFDPREAHAGDDGFAPGQYAFVLSPQSIQAEFHTERTLRYFSVPLDFQDLSARLTTVEIGGRRLRTFSIEDTLVMLCVHGAKHFWDRLGWVLDIGKLVTVQEVDWRLLLGIAEKMKSTRVALLGLFLAHDLFGAELPPLVLQKACRDRRVRKLADKVYEQYAGISEYSDGVLQRAAFRVQSRDGMGQGLRHVLRLAMEPTESDRQMVRLPHWLSPLYTVVRPCRLLREYGMGFKRR